MISTYEPLGDLGTVKNGLVNAIFYSHLCDLYASTFICFIMTNVSPNSAPIIEYCMAEENDIVPQPGWLERDSSTLVYGWK